MEAIRASSNVMEVCRKNLSFWLAIVFIIAGFIYVATEVLLGERMMSKADFEWRIMQFVVWFGFLLGLSG